MKKPRVIFIVYDENNRKYAEMFKRSLRYFHSEEELPLVEYTEDKIKEIGDPAFFYRATPYIAKELIKDYELVIKADADQLALGKLDHILYTWKDYDVGTVLNINRVDPPIYGLVAYASIAPNEYYNNGLVALRSEGFINEWWNLCCSKHFDRMPMREQGFLNILAHYGSASGRYNIRCFDGYDRELRISTLNGLVAKGEGLRMKVENEEVVLYPDNTGYPDKKVVIKLYHWASGNTPNKMNYRTDFSDEVISFIDKILDVGK